MTDIESMYYQVRVSKYQQSFIKFLWWESHNRGRASNFALCTHVLGGVLSASCSNCTLKTATTDNPDQCGQEAAELVRNNF